MPTVTQTRAANRKQYENRKRLGLCRGCGVSNRKPRPGRALCTKCSNRKLGRYYRYREQMLSHQQKYIRRMRLATLDAYGGPVCKCCGDKNEEFLTIDHIDGRGAEHRRTIKRGGHSFYLWLKQNGFPKGFRVLCMNCNFSLGMRGYCPHKGGRHDVRKVRGR